MQLRKRKPTEHPLWRPDFRNTEDLPDIKVIRTDFLLNLISICVAVLLLGFVAVREYRMISLRGEIADLDADISQTAASNRENLRMSGEFRRLQAGMEEFVQFRNVPLTPDHLVTELTDLQPDPVVLNSVNFTGASDGKGKNAKVTYTLILTGSVEHSLEQPAPSVITEFRSALEALPSVEPYFIDSELSGFNRNDALGLFNFTIRIRLSETPRPAQS